MAQKPKKKIEVKTLIHDEAARRNIPTAEYQSVIAEKDRAALQIALERRDRDLDPQLVWRGKDQQNTSDLVIQAPPLYIQEKVHPKVLIDDLLRQAKGKHQKGSQAMPDLFSDFNGLPNEEARAEFYQHDANWSNRMILGDSLQVMASLVEREGLRNKVQCIYIDPPYGIKFNSNFQWSTTSHDVKDGKAAHITREPEQVKAFRDTWQDGIHSYLSYLRDRLAMAQNLLTESGSVFVQIGDENSHHVRELMDEIFGAKNFVTQIYFSTTGGFASSTLSRVGDYLIWYARDRSKIKYRQLFLEKPGLETGDRAYRHIELMDGSRRPMTTEERNGSVPLPDRARIFSYGDLQSSGAAPNKTPFEFDGKTYYPKSNNHWKANWPDGMNRLKAACRIGLVGNTLRYVRYVEDNPVNPLTNSWMDTSFSGFTTEKKYVVETNPKVIQRCILMTTDPGDLVFDPTCGSGTTSYVAEQWGRRWITTDTSRVALALARARIMGARYSWYLLADSPEGAQKEAKLRHRVPSQEPTSGNIRHGFVYERVPHITLGSISKNSEIDTIWETRQDDPTVRQNEIEDSIVAKAEQEYLYDKPYVDSTRVRVAGPFTVESLAPHRMLAVDENDELFSESVDEKPNYGEAPNFIKTILDNLKMAGVQQTHKEDRIDFTSLTFWPGQYVCAEGHYLEGDKEATTTRRAGIFVGPEFGTVTRPDLVTAAREASEAGFDMLIACAFNFDAHSAEFKKLGSIPVLKARTNADLHMAKELKNTGTGNLFVVFGEPDIDILKNGGEEIQVRINGIDVFHPNTGEIRSDDPDSIACWFIDTDYNEESFFVRHAYFLGVKDPYKALKTTLKTEIDADTWNSLKSHISRPFPMPTSRRIAVKVINHLGDEVMKVFSV